MLAFEMDALSNINVITILIKYYLESKINIFHLMKLFTI